MMKSKSVIKLLLLSALFFVGCNPLNGCVESEFKLATESRLPCWFDPMGYSRKDLTVIMDHYVGPFGIKVVAILQGPAPERKILSKKAGKFRRHPVSEKHEYGKYPRYSIVTIDNCEEVFEQKKLEPTLYIVDDPKLINAIRKH